MIDKYSETLTPETTARQPILAFVPPVFLLNAKTPAFAALFASPPRLNHGFVVAFGEFELSPPQPPILEAGARAKDVYANMRS